MAISSISQFSTAIDSTLTFNAEQFASSVASNYMYGSVAEQGLEMSVNEYGCANAFRVVEGGLGSDGVMSTATEVLEFEPVVEAGEVVGTKVVKMPATTTNAGAVKAGALSGKVPIGTVVGGIAIGAGIGLMEAANHRQFWEDLVSVGDGINTPEQTMRVIWRMMSDGSIQSYCDKRSVDRIIQRMYEFNVLNSGRVEPTIDHAGLQEVNYGVVDVQVVTSAGAVSGQAISASAITSAFNGAIAGAGLNPFNAISANCSSGRVSVTLYNMPDEVYIEHVEGDVYRVVNPQNYGVTCCVVAYDPQTGDITSINYESPSSFCYTAPYLNTTINYGFCSNVGAIVIPHNPAVIDNPDALQAPADPDDFWTTFSEWLSNGFTQPGYNPLNNSIVPTTWIPFTMPNINWQIDPAVGTQPDAWTGIYDFPDIFTDPTTVPVPDVDPWIWKTIGDYVVPHIDIPYPTPTPYDDTPTIDPIKPNSTGNTPAITAPTGDVSTALYTVYNPTQAQINSLGAYLWTQNIIEIIEQFFQNPLDAIISLHLIYCTPSTSGTKNIKLGYLDSGVSASVVNSRYVKIECGSVSVPEVYHNALDYDNVSLQIFLPFIGFREINPKECVSGKISVSYDIDVYTGVCLASIYVVKANSRQLLYTFEGICSVDIPLTSADRSRLVSGLITAGVSAYTGNPAGVVGGLASVHASIERSGSFSGNAGAMGVKKPYLIIKRAISAQANNYAKLYGYPLNKSERLGAFKGFTRVQSVHVDIPKATDYEKKLISDLLRNGVII